MRAALVVLGASPVKTASQNGDVGWFDLAISTLLVAVAVVLSIWQRLALERSMVWAALRAAVQLLIVGSALGIIFEPKRPIALSWIWVGLMVVFAAFTARQRAREVPSVFPIALGATGAAAAVSLGVIFGLGIFPTEGRTIVPLGGMMVGNSMTATIVAARRIVAELSDKRLEVEARLALGQPWPEAARPYVRSALRTALSNQIETTKAVGLVALPGAMTGLILAGVKPLDAVKVQAAIMYLILGSVATTVTVVALGLTRQLFTSDHRLVPLRREVG